MTSLIESCNDIRSFDHWTFGDQKILFLRDGLMAQKNHPFLTLGSSEPRDNPKSKLETSWIGFVSFSHAPRSEINWDFGTHCKQAKCTPRNWLNLRNLMPQKVRNVLMTDGCPINQMPPSARKGPTSSHGIQSREAWSSSCLPAHVNDARRIAILLLRSDEEEEICNEQRSALHRPLYAIAAICGWLWGQRVQRGYYCPLCF